jgi:hypothetical protein
LLKKFYQIILDNHDLQVRFKWRNVNDIGEFVLASGNTLSQVADYAILAIWDNRSAFHSATFDYEGLGERSGNRVVGIGEKPYLDLNSKSKAEALASSVGVGS